MNLDIGWTDALDIAIVAVVLWAGITWLRQTRARLALLGLLILGAVYVFATQLGLHLTVWIFSGFFAVFVVVLVVVFQEDLRRIFERIALWGLRRRQPAVPSDTVDTVSRALAHLAATRTGALIVLPGREPVDRHMEGGVELAGRLSEPLLYSIFDSSSPGHDGAVLLTEDTVARFAVHLPLSSDRGQLASLGTRHAAALGLAERTDALCVVVSEERGAVSVARHGELRRLERPAEVAAVIREFLDEVTPETAPPRLALLRVVLRWREAAVAVGLAAALWLVAVAGNAEIQHRVDVPVAVEQLPEGSAIVSMDPREVTVTLSARRWDLFRLDDNALQIRLDGRTHDTGVRSYPIFADSLDLPARFGVADVSPSRVRVSVETSTARTDDRELPPSAGSPDGRSGLGPGGEGGQNEPE